MLSRTFRDQKKYKYKHHNEVCTRYTWPLWNSHTCVCDTWWEYHCHMMPEPSWWNRGMRQKERAFTRNRMQRARAGCRDWSCVDGRSTDECYW